MRSDDEINETIDRYSDLVYRLCMVNLKNQADTEDIFQTVFLKYAQNKTVFASKEHEKAWFIRVTINACRDLLKSFFKRKTVPLDSLLEMAAQRKDDHLEVYEALMALPQKEREIIYLYYYEGYSAIEIADLLKIKVNTIYTLMARARGKLKKILEDDYE